MRKLGIRTLVIVVAMYGIYVLGANLFLNTGVGFELINKRPEKMHIQWSSGATFWPGIVTIRGFQIRGQSKRMQWFCEMPEGTFTLSLLALASKRIEIRKGRGDGFGFRTRRRLAPEAGKTELADLQPEIPGFSNPPDPAPEDLYPPRKGQKDPWHLRIHQVSLEGPIDLWLNRMRIAGIGKVGGSVDYLLGREMEIPAAILELENGEFLIDSEAFAEQLSVSIAASFEPFVLEQTRGLGVLEFIRAEVAIPSAVVPDLDVFSKMVAAGTAMTSLSGSASLAGSLSVAEPGSAEAEFTLKATGVDIVSLDARTRGDVEVVAKLRKGDLVAGRFDVTGTRIRLENIVDSAIKKTRKEPWWARVELLHGEVDLGEPMAINTTIELELKDSRPLIALFGAKAMPNIKSLQGTVDMALDAEMLVLEPMSLSGKGLVLLGRLSIGEGKPRGAIYVKYRGIPLAVHLTGDKTKLVMKKPLRWYEAQPSIR